jgi:alkylresorcinol/alkylpyrone synthase
VATEAVFWGFGTALPELTIDSQQTVAALSQVWPHLRGVNPEPITRHLVAPVDWLMAPRSLGDSMRAYREHAPRLAAIACRRALAAAGVAPNEIDLVISVSCTGYLVPSLDAALVWELGLRPDLIRLPITELGCSGGAAAIAAARRHLAGFPQDRVLVVAVEVPSLTFQRRDHSLDNLTASLVFGDGAAAAVIGPGRPGEDRLKVLDTGARLLPDSTQVLGFELGDGGFHTVLDRRLPGLVGRHLGELVAEVVERWGMGRPGFYAVHAGGPRIFDAVESALGLAPSDLDLSRRLFRSVGNLSSASILFILAALGDGVSGDGLAIAFGPGVTVELARLRRGPAGG